MFVHWKEVRNISEGATVVGSLEPFSGQAVDEMIASGMEGARV